MALSVSAVVRSILRPASYHSDLFLLLCSCCSFPAWDSTLRDYLIHFTCLLLCRSGNIEAGIGFGFTAIFIFYSRFDFRAFGRLHTTWSIKSSVRWHYRVHMNVYRIYIHRVYHHLRTIWAKKIHYDCLSHWHTKIKTTK